METFLINLKKFSFINDDSPKSRLAVFRKPTSMAEKLASRNLSRKRFFNEREVENYNKIEEQKRCKNAVSKNVFNHVDVLKIIFF